MKMLASFFAVVLLANSAYSQSQGPSSPVLPTTGGPTVSVSPPAYIGTPSGSAGASSVTDADILTFAYNLEVLEGQFYSCAAFGTPLDSSLLGGGPAPSSCRKANLTSTTATYAAELAREETAHVSYLYNALKAAGANPVAPAVNIDTAFEAAAEAAFMTTTPLSPTFDPYANDVLFLHGAFIFEDLGVSAYLGAGSLITSPAYRLAAGQIGNTEGYHSALIRTLLYQIIDTTPAYGNTVGQITSAIVAVLNKLAGAPQIKYGLTNSQGASISNVDSQGLTPAASVAQVTKTVTLGAPSGSGGGFFPSNTVGNIKN